MSEDKTEKPQIVPRRLWFIASAAADAGWDVSIRRRGAKWRLALSETHHCVHLDWTPSKTNNCYPWQMHTKQLSTRCPHGDGVHLRDLTVWLVEHPTKCAPTHDRPPRTWVPHGIVGCEDHLTPNPKPTAFDGSPLCRDERRKTAEEIVKGIETWQAANDFARPPDWYNALDASLDIAREIGAR